MLIYISVKYAALSSAISEKVMGSCSINREFCQKKVFTNQILKNGMVTLGEN